jgi:hypothetical protein
MVFVENVTCFSQQKNGFHQSWTDVNKVNSWESHHNQVRVFWFVL